MRTTQAKVNPQRPGWGMAFVLLALALMLSGCAVTERLGVSAAPAVPTPGLATPIPTPSPVVISTPARDAASGDSAVAGSGTNRRLSTSSMTYNGEIMAEAIVPVVAQAQAANDQWQWELGVYGWFPAIGITTSFPSGSSGPSIDASASDVLDSLKMTFMGQVEARKGQWGVWSDLVYSDVGGSKDDSGDFTVDGNPVSASANLGLDVKSMVWSLAGIYNLSSTPENTTDLLFGARMLDMKQTLDWSLASSIPELPTRNGRASVDGTDWDAIVGLKGRYFLGAERKWFLPYYVDVGSGQSELTWQINAGVGYTFQWGSVFATWRYLDYEFQSGDALQSMDMNGPLIGAAFQF